MIKQSCDRCGADVTAKKFTTVHAIVNVKLGREEEGTFSADLCPPCSGELFAWLKPTQARRKQPERKSSERKST